MNRAGKAMIMALLTMGAAGCGERREAVPEPEPAMVLKPVTISGEAALQEVQALVALGLRDSGTPGAERAARHLRERLEALGLEAEIQEFREASPKGNIAFRNVIGRIPGAGDGLLLFGSHYDTKTGMPEGFEGANDSGSSTGLLLEMARGFRAAGTPPMEIRFIFFDGEESMVEYGPADGFHGSKHLARTMAADGSLPRVAALILLDMVGDRDLTITIPRNSTPWLASLAFDAARAEGVRRHFQLYPYMIFDDHDAFLERGVPAVNLIDFHFGSRPGQNDYWHTVEDTMDKLSADSLEIVGRVAVRMAEEIMRRGGGPAK
jgi:glutaminyl-peptide cyclotransferase